MTYTFFLAHASPDHDWVRKLYHALQPEPCVLDRVTVGPGTPWQATLVEAQASSRATVVLVSRRAPNAWYLQDEIARALDLMRRENHRVFVVWLEGRPTRSQDVPYGLYAINGLDGQALGPGGVASALRAEIAQIPATPVGPPPEPPPPASSELLYDAAVRLLRPALEEIVKIRLRAPAAEFRTGTQADYAADLILWAEGQEPAVRAKLEEHLRRRVPAAFS